MNNLLSNKLPIPFIPMKGKICSHVSPTHFFSRIVDHFQIDHNCRCPFPNHRDTDPSFRVKEDGRWRCYGCPPTNGRRYLEGTNIVEFYSQWKRLKFQQATKELYDQYICKELPQKKISTFCKDLTLHGGMMEYLRLSRGWSADVIKHFKIGLTSQNDVWLITIPVKDEYGRIVSCKYYNVTGAANTPKFYYDGDGKGEGNTPKIFNLPVLTRTPKIYLVEGEPDALAAMSAGLPAVTFGSAKAWLDSFAHYFQGFEVVVVYDNDDAGRAGADMITAKLRHAAKTIKQVTLPMGQDLTDFLRVRHFDSKEFVQLEQESNYRKNDPVEFSATSPSTFDAIKQQAIAIPLSEASHAKYHKKMLKVTALVAGKEQAPYLVPKHIEFMCRDNPTPAKCAGCALGKTPDQSLDFTIDAFHPKLLEWTVKNPPNPDLVYRRGCGIEAKKCLVDVDITEYWNLEKCLVTEPVTQDCLSNSTDRRLAFFLGHGITPNRHYKSFLYTVPHPSDNSACHIVVQHDSMDTELDSFVVTENTNRDLKSFQCPPTIELMANKLGTIYKHYAASVTKIFGRPMLHLACDLLFFAPNQFVFAGEAVPRTGLDVLVFGDQRCGKGRVAEGLMKYYHFGELMSGENTSLMNLIGGIETTDNYRGLRWGRWVANDRGVVVVDEAGALPLETFGKLSRIRSEGIADIDKYGIHSKASARTSTLWLSNPRESSLDTFNYGCEAIQTLIGQPEDIARFDYALVVRTQEVDSDEINKAHDDIDDPYGPKLHRLLILWCKTRTPEQVHFTGKAVTRIYELAKILGAKYHPSIPLVQSENMRIKLAKVAAALAGRLYSCSEDGEKLIIELGHVNYASQFLQALYDAPNMGYKDYSALMNSTQENLSWPNLDKLFQDLRDRGTFRQFASGMLRLKSFTSQDICDLSGLFVVDAKELLGGLAQESALLRRRNAYIKTPGFIAYLKDRYVT